MNNNGNTKNRFGVEIDVVSCTRGEGDDKVYSAYTTTEPWFYAEGKSEEDVENRTRKAIGLYLQYLEECPKTEIKKTRQIRTNPGHVYKIAAFSTV